ncbi:SWIM zinc finger family protein [Mycoplasma sp. P36-A1]|uniref:SWIM zinc finger family protein n=1 Tax=Mycoplasma sp. P36-A1 TaxID=3252900 RepID=UPI003C3040EA
MEDYMKLFKPFVWDRGSTLFTDGKITNLYREDYYIHSVVKDRGYNYVRIQFDEDTLKVIDMRCDCPIGNKGNDCKHMAATLSYIDAAGGLMEIENDYQDYYDEDHDDDEIFFNETEAYEQQHDDDYYNESSEDLDDKDISKITDINYMKILNKYKNNFRNNDSKFISMFDEEVSSYFKNELDKVKDKKGLLNVNNEIILLLKDIAPFNFNVEFTNLVNIINEFFTLASLYLKEEKIVEITIIAVKEITYQEELFNIYFSKYFDLIVNVKYPGNDTDQIYFIKHMLTLHEENNDTERLQLIINLTINKLKILNYPYMKILDLLSRYKKYEPVIYFQVEHYLNSNNIDKAKTALFEHNNSIEDIETYKTILDKLFNEYTDANNRIHYLNLLQKLNDSNAYKLTSKYLLKFEKLFSSKQEYQNYMHSQFDMITHTFEISRMYDGFLESNQIDLLLNLLNETNDIVLLMSYKEKLIQYNEMLFHQLFLKIILSLLNNSEYGLNNLHSFILEYSKLANSEANIKEIQLYLINNDNTTDIANIIKEYNGDHYE